MILKTAIIKKLPSGKYRLYSKKKDPKTGKRKNLGTYDTLGEVKNREKQIQFFKHHADDGKTDNALDALVSKISDIAVYLEEAGFIDEAEQLYSVMDCVDRAVFIPNEQMNTENMSYTGGDGIGGGYTSFTVPLAVAAEKLVRIANYLDRKGFYKKANRIDAILKKLVHSSGLEQKQILDFIKKIVENESYNLDALITNNGKMGNSVVEAVPGSAGGYADNMFFGSYTTRDSIEPSNLIR